MSLFTEPVDRFFVGKLFFGLLFAWSFFKLLQLLLKAVFLVTELFPRNRLVMPGWEALLAYGFSGLLWLVLFRIVEGRRRMSSGPNPRRVHTAA